MKKSLLLFLVSILIMSCTKTIKSESKWIDIEDLNSVTKLNDFNLIQDRLGNPVFFEIKNDTLSYYYKFRPYQYSSWSSEKGYVKPRESDKTDDWAGELLMLKLLIHNNKLVGVEKDYSYKNTSKSDMELKKEIEIIRGVFGLVAVSILSFVIYGNEP